MRLAWRHPTFLALWIAAGLVFALDRWSKHWAVTELALVHTRPLFGEWMRLTYVRNTGVAFGLGAGQGLPFAAITGIALALVVLLALQPRNRTWTRSIALGLVVGGAASVLLGRVLEPALYVSAFDPLSLSIGVGVLLLAGVAASLVPARRATSIDPMSVLRQD